MHFLSKKKKSKEKHKCLANLHAICLLPSKKVNICSVVYLLQNPVTKRRDSEWHLFFYLHNSWLLDASLAEIFYLPGYHVYFDWCKEFSQCAVTSVTKVCGMHTKVCIYSNHSSSKGTGHFFKDSRKIQFWKVILVLYIMLSFVRITQ